MNIFNIFKSKWSAAEMKEDDRRRIFWYLKRKTSYTAWRREAEIFDRFAAVFEQQVREEPYAPGLMDGTNWEPFYSKVLKAQVLYEQALERLHSGDRTIFLYNSRGAMDDATTLSEYWYTELVNHGMRNDHFYDGKYVPLMTALIHEFFMATQQRGYIQPMMADTPAPEIWSTILHDNLAKLPVPTVLPDVPEATTETLVKTGNEVPMFGIYEPQIKDGCMNYLLGGTIAPFMLKSDGTYATGDMLAVTWRLIWEDNRYLDKIIPPEELTYFPILAADITPSLFFVDDMISTTSGMPCPKTGNWVVMDNLDIKLYIKRNVIMPQHGERNVYWVWVSN